MTTNHPHILKRKKKLLRGHNTGIDEKKFHRTVRQHDTQRHKQYIKLNKKKTRETGGQLG